MIFLGDKIPTEDPNWELLLLLSEIIEILYTENVEEGRCCSLEELIKSHHKLFKKLYPLQNLKKKHHNMVHYPASIRRIGCPANYCTLRFEAKHVFFKTAQRVSHNFKNIPLTLAKKHQICFANNLLNSNLLNKSFLVSKGQDVTFSELNQSIKLRLSNLLEVVDHDFITIAESIQHYGIVYKKNDIVLKCSKNGCLFLCAISKIFVFKV